MTNTGHEQIDNSRDGIDFINIYSRGKTQLGRKLSHFHKATFVHPYFGQFMSVEGLWYWLRCAERPDILRYKYGFQAKKLGYVYKPVWYSDFWEDIAGANYQKIIQNKDILEELKESTLPFKHYYVFDRTRSSSARTITDDSEQQFPVIARDADKLCGYMEEIRNAVKNDIVPECWTHSEKRLCSHK